MSREHEIVFSCYVELLQPLPYRKNDGQSYVGQIYEFKIITSLMKHHLAICKFAK